MKVCSFTGHREIKPAHKAALPGLLERAIGYAYSEGCREFIAGGALGFDTEAAKVVIRFRMQHPDVRLHIIVPCADQAVGWRPSERSFYEYVMGAADQVTVLAQNYYEGCMKARNYELASRCDILIAYLSRSGSGAGQTVRMAQAQGKKVYNLYPALDGIV